MVVLVAVPLALTVITMGAVFRAVGQVTAEAHELTVAVARVATLRPVVAEIGEGTRRLGAGIGRLGR